MGGESLPTKFILEKKIEMGDENPNIEDSQLVSMDFVQEFQGVMLTYSCGNMFVINDSGPEEMGEVEGGILGA